MIKRFWRAVDLAELWLSYAAIAVLVAVTLWVSFGAVMRHVFDAPVIGVVQFSEYALLYITFLGTARVLRQGEHVEVDLLTRVLGPHWRARARGANAFLGLLVSSVLLYFSALATWTAYSRGSFRPTIVEVPTWIVMVVIPVGSLFLALRFLKYLLDGLSGVEAAARKD